MSRSLSSAAHSRDPLAHPDYGCYQSPFKFSGSLNRVEVDIAPTKLGALELQKIKEAMKATANFAE